MFVSSAPTLLHADVDAFFAAVEQRDDRRLRGRPVIVGGGVVLACSYEAKARGVRSGMGGREARRRCPQAIVVPPRFQAYVEASKAIFAVFAEAAPRVEKMSLEEAFLDVRGLERISGTPREIAARLRDDVRREVGVTITVGVARTKILAKMASRMAKPDGLLVVDPERELAFLHPIAVEKLWGVGDATARRLRKAGILTVADAARLGEPALIAVLGRAGGRHLHALAHNRDVRPVQSGRRRRSIGSQHALGRGRRSAAALDAVLVGLVDRVAGRMRAKERAGRTVVLRLRFGDYTRASRSHTLPWPTARTSTILAVVRSLLSAAAGDVERRGLTLLGITVTGLSSEAEHRQLVLPFPAARLDALDAVIDDVRERFGSDAVIRAVLLGRRRRTSLAFPDP